MNPDRKIAIIAGAHISKKPAATPHCPPNDILGLRDGYPIGAHQYRFLCRVSKLRSEKNDN